MRPVRDEDKRNKFDVIIVFVNVYDEKYVSTAYEACTRNLPHNFVSASLLLCKILHTFKHHLTHQIYIN